MKTNTHEITSSKIVNLRTENNDGKLKVEYGTSRSFVPSYYDGNESLYIVLSDYLEVNGQKVPLTIDYYGPNGNFRLHSSFSGTQVKNSELVKGQNFLVRDVPHTELVSQHDDLASLTIELLTLIEFIRNRDHAGLRRNI